MTIEQVVFDIDNTFGSFVCAQMKKLQVFETVAAEHLKQSPKKIREYLKELNNAEGLDNSFVIQGIKAFREFYFDPAHEKEMWELITSGRDVSKIYTKPYEGVTETLSTLKHNKIKMAVWSDAPWFKGVGRLIRMGLSDYFTVICAQKTSFDYHELYTPTLLKIYVDEEIAQVKKYGGMNGNNEGIIQVLNHHKPHLEGLDKIVAITGIPPEKMMMVGDNVTKDYSAQEKAGMCAILTKEDLPTEEDYELLKRYIDMSINKSKSTRGQTDEGVKRKVNCMPETLYYLLEENKEFSVKSEDRMVLKPIISKLENENYVIGLSKTINTELKLVEFNLKLVDKSTILNFEKEYINLASLPIALDFATKEPNYFYKNGNEIIYCKKKL